MEPSPLIINKNTGRMTAVTARRQRGPGMRAMKALTSIVFWLLIEKSVAFPTSRRQSSQLPRVRVLSSARHLSMAYINGNVNPINDGQQSNSIELGETTVAPLIVEDGDDNSLYTEEEDGLYYTSEDKTSRRQMALMWCGTEFCKDTIRERVVGDRNQIVLAGPATGQVAFWWMDSSDDPKSRRSSSTTTKPVAEPSVLILVKQNDDALMKIAAQAVKELTSHQVHVLLDPELSAKLKHYFGVDDDRIKLFEPRTFSGFGASPSTAGESRWPGRRGVKPHSPRAPQGQDPWKEPYPDLICTLGGDGLLMHAGMMFQGPVPPILCVAGGSLGCLTPFAKEEMVDGVRIALGIITGETSDEDDAKKFMRPGSPSFQDDNVETYPPNMNNYPYKPLSNYYDEMYEDYDVMPPPHAQQADQKKRFSFGWGDRICLSMRMRLECCVLNREGIVQARINVLNEVVIDRGQSPYLANLECYCDDVHLTTVQADGIIFAT